MNKLYHRVRLVIACVICLTIESCKHTPEPCECATEEISGIADEDKAEDCNNQLLAKEGKWMASYDSCFNKALKGFPYLSNKRWEDDIVAYVRRTNKSILKGDHVIVEFDTKPDDIADLKQNLSDFKGESVQLQSESVFQNLSTGVGERIKVSCWISKDEFRKKLQNKSFSSLKVYGTYDKTFSNEEGAHVFGMDVTTRNRDISIDNCKVLSLR